MEKKFNSKNNAIAEEATYIEEGMFYAMLYRGKEGKATEAEICRLCELNDKDEVCAEHYEARISYEGECDCEEIVLGKTLNIGKIKDENGEEKWMIISE